jgi:hypothetical protein
MQDHFSPVDELLNRAQGVDWVRGCSTGCGKCRCEKRHKHHDHGTHCAVILLSQRAFTWNQTILISDAILVD